MARKPELQLPSDFVEQVWDAAKDAERALQFDLPAAIEASHRELALLKEAERASNRRLHKGHPLHNLGVAWWGSERPRARRYFMAAHVEDARLWPRRKPKPVVWSFLATRMLTTLFGESARVLAQAARFGRANPRRDPLEVADEVTEMVPPPICLSALWGSAASGVWEQSVSTDASL